MWLDTAIVLLYIALLVGMGLRGGRGVKNAKDFTASSGQYGTLVIFATLSASYVGGGYSSGNAEKAFESGIGTTLTLFGFSLSMIFIGRYLVPGVARFPGVSTVGGIIGQCYGRSARLLTGVFSFICCAGVVGAQMEAMGLVFHVLLGVDKHVGILIGCGMLALLWLRTRTASPCFSLWLPFLLCGVPLLTLRRRAWLPCLWVCGWMALARWQHIPWHWLRSDLQDCSLGEDFPLLLILCGALLLAALSLFACRKAVLPWSGQRLAGVWGGFLAAAVLRFGLDRLVLSQINTSVWPDGVYRQDCYDLLLGFWQLTDVLLWLALTAALIATDALLRGRKADKIAS